MGANLDKILGLAGATDLDTPEPEVDYDGPDWDEGDWDDVREHLVNESPWFGKVLAGESPGEPDADEVKMTPRTAEASTVPEPTGKPGGPGLFHVKGLQLPPYVQHLYKHLVARYGKHRAYGVAIGIVKKWAAGVNPGGKGKGHKVHADVQAAAGKNVAQWEKDKAAAHADDGHKTKTTNTPNLDQILGLASPAAWPSGKPYADSFLPKPGGGPGSGKTKLKQGYPARTGATATAPGAQPIVYGQLRQAPSQTVAAGPPLPPGVALPDPKEFEDLAGKISDGPDRALAESARQHLTQAARKLRTGDRQGPLALLRIVQTDLHALYRAVVLANRPHMAQVFSEKGFSGAVPPVAQSSARAEMFSNQDQMLEYRAQVTTVAQWIDRFRRVYFHGQYQGVPEGRFTAAPDGTIALADVLGYERHTPMGRIVNVTGYHREGLPPFTGKLVGPEADEAIRRGEARGEFGEPTGYFQTSDGKKMWGWHGAAGLLVRHTDEQGTKRYLLQKRAAWVDQGNTWSTPGGAMDHHGGVPETPEEAAHREALEEFGRPLPEGTRLAEVRTKTFGEGPGAWSYHTVVMDAPHMFDPEGSGVEGVHDTRNESRGYRWATPDEMADLPLHSHFRATAEEFGMPAGGGTRPPEAGGNKMGLARGWSLASPADLIASGLAVALAQNLEQVTGSGKVLLPLPPVPKDTAPMFTAHRVDDMVSHFAHASERIAAARRLPLAARKYYTVHASNQIARTLDAGRLLAGNLKRNYPAEGEELDSLAKEMAVDGKGAVSLARAVRPAEKASTLAHLLQSVMYDAGHAKKHVDVMHARPGSEKVWDFNADHAEKHIDSGREHALKLAVHIRDNYPQEWKHLSGLAQRRGYEDLQLTAPLPDLIARGLVALVGGATAVKGYERTVHGKVEHVKPSFRHTLVFDYDGVLNATQGYHWPADAQDFSGIDHAHARGYNAAIVTANDPPLVARELEKAGYKTELDPQMRILFWTGGSTGKRVLVTNRKVSGKAYIDDRAVNHRWGDDWGKTMDDAERVAHGLGPVGQDPDRVAFAGPPDGVVRVWLHLKPEEPGDPDEPATLSQPAGPKKGQGAVHYRDGTRAERCGNCSMVRIMPPDFETLTCTSVRGPIRDDGVCDIWELSPDAADGALHKFTALTDARVESALLSLTADYQHVMQEAVDNNAFRRVMITGPKAQVVLMSIPVGDDIGAEVHKGTDQMFLVASGSARAKVDGKVWHVSSGDLVYVPKGTQHDVVNTGSVALKLVTIYAPPEHKEGEVQLDKPATPLTAERVESALLALTHVDPYKRIEKGKVVVVKSYDRRQGRFVDVLGHRHWGWYGGAGILPWHQDESGTIRYGLQKRAGGVQHSGTFSTAGGAIDMHEGKLETPEEAAKREAIEEFGDKIPEGEITKVYTDQHGTAGEPGAWAYHTVHIKYPEQFKPSGTASHASESGGIKWVTPEEMAKLPLHPDFRSYAESHLGVVPDESKQPKDYTIAQQNPDSDFRKGDIIQYFHKGNGVDAVTDATVRQEPDSRHPTYLVQPHLEYTATGKDGKPKPFKQIELKREAIVSEPPGHAPKTFKTGPVGAEPRAPGELRAGDDVKWTGEDGKERSGRVTWVHGDGSVDVAKPPPPYGQGKFKPGDRVVHWEKGGKKAGVVTGSQIKTDKLGRYAAYAVKYDDGSEGEHAADRITSEKYASQKKDYSSGYPSYSSTGVVGGQHPVFPGGTTAGQGGEVAKEPLFRENDRVTWLYKGQPVTGKITGERSTKGGNYGVTPDGGKSVIVKEWEMAPEGQPPPGSVLKPKAPKGSMSPVTGGKPKKPKFAEGDVVKRRSFQGNEWTAGTVVKANVTTSALGYPVHQVLFSHGAENVPESMLKRV